MERIKEIEKYLQEQRTVIETAIKADIQESKKSAIESNDEETANALWCLEKIVKIQNCYVLAYEHLKKACIASNEYVQDKYDTPKSKEYEMAWNLLDECDIDIGFLETNYCLESSIKEYHIPQILDDIKRLERLFPYRSFFSRETIIKKMRCSICGKIVSVRNPCPHIKGRLYMGKMCLHEVIDMEFISENIVTHPFDKYAILKLEGKKFDFSLLDYIVPHLAPYKDWSYDVEKRLLKQYARVGRNELCPCGSGQKFKKCIVANRDIHYEDHYIFRV